MFLIPVMPLVIVSRLACQRMFQLSNPGVARTFIEDCRFFFKLPTLIFYLFLDNVEITIS